MLIYDYLSGPIRVHRLSGISRATCMSTMIFYLRNTLTVLSPSTFITLSLSKYISLPYVSLTMILHVKSLSLTQTQTLSPGVSFLSTIPLCATRTPPLTQRYLALLRYEKVQLCFLLTISFSHTNTNFYPRVSYVSTFSCMSLTRTLYP